MGKHYAELVLHDAQGTAFEILQGSEAMGHVEIKNGGILWYPAGKKRQWFLSWDRLADGSGEDQPSPRWSRQIRAFDVRKYLRRSRG